MPTSLPHTDERPLNEWVAARLRRNLARPGWKPGHRRIMREMLADLAPSQVAA